MSLRSAALASVLALGVSVAAHAAPIAAGSTLDVNGSNQAIGGNGSVNTATGLDFLTIRTSSIPATATGTFAGLFSAGLAGTVNDIPRFNPFTAVSPLFSFTENGRTLSFTLSTLNVANRTAPSGLIPGSLTITGMGFFALTGFDNTIAGFTLSTQGNGATTFSASTTTGTAVPEPASVALLGLGLLGVAAARRRMA